MRKRTFRNYGDLPDEIDFDSALDALEQFDKRRRAGRHAAENGAHADRRWTPKDRRRKPDTTALRS